MATIMIILLVRLQMLRLQVVFFCFTNLCDAWSTALMQQTYQTCMHGWRSTVRACRR